MWVSQEIDGKMFIFMSKPSHVTPQIYYVGKTIPVLRVSTYIYECFQGYRWGNVHFANKPWHVNPQFDRLSKMSPFLRVSTDIYAVSKDIGGNIFIFQLNLGMLTLNLIVSEKQALF